MPYSSAVPAWQSTAAGSATSTRESVAMHSVLEDLIALLELERIEDNIFRGDSRDIGSAQVFGNPFRHPTSHRKTEMP